GVDHRSDLHVHARRREGERQPLGWLGDVDASVQASGRRKGAVLALSRILAPVEGAGAAVALGEFERVLSEVEAGGLQLASQVVGATPQIGSSGWIVERKAGRQTPFGVDIEFHID